jgi:hypothetical protein
MHFFYIDEAGCNLRDLQNDEAPIFVLGGVVVKDKGWNKTHGEYEEIISAYFDNSVPANFELHSYELLSPNGDGFFANHPRDKRNKLATDLLRLLQTRGHQVFIHAIDKQNLHEADITQIRNKDHIELKTPYLLCYDNAITTIEQYVKEKLGSTARAMVIIDEKDALKNEIESITKIRRFNPSKAKRIKWIAEFSYPIDSQKNPMVQLSDLVCFVTKKYLGIENGYHNNYPIVAKDFYRELYKIIDDRLIRKGIVPEEGRHAEPFNAFIGTITCKTKNGWKKRVY